MNDNILELHNLEKSFKQGAQKLNIFKGLSLNVKVGEIVALVGQSGSGKSTLLQIAGLLDKPSSGQVIVQGKPVGMDSDKERTRLRRDEIGFIYQFHHLLPEFNALENVAMPLTIAGKNKRESIARAEELLKDLGLGHRLTHRPAQLSGGEQQRVAIARALAHRPKLILADEPTGNLDPKTSSDVFEILLEQVRGRKIGALIATHNIELAKRMDRMLILQDGSLEKGEIIC